ncbi:MAG: SPASM domain-containing protein [Flexilinea sp.]
MQQSIKYAKKEAEKLGIRLWITVYTNGYLSDKEREWAGENINRAVISLEGPPLIHDFLRPLSNGLGSQNKVYESCLYFDSVGLQYQIRLTATEETVQQLPNNLKYFSESLACKNYRVEPLFLDGRCLNYPTLRPPLPSDFVEYFLLARRTAIEKGISLIYSGIDMNHSNGRFCGATGDNFIVNWNGEIYSCFLAAGSENPRFAPFRYGFYDPETKNFVFNRNDLRRLRNRVWWKLPGCQECEAVFVCAGDCLAKAALDQDLNNPAGTLRCQINRLLFRVVQS